MAFENFLERLMVGDIRAFVVLALLALFVFIIYRNVQKMTRPYRGYFKFIGFLLVGLAIYIWIVNPGLHGVRFIFEDRSWRSRTGIPVVPVKHNRPDARDVHGERYVAFSGKIASDGSRISPRRNRANR